MIAAMMAVGLAVLAAWLLHPRERLAGTNSVEPAVWVTNLFPRQRLCVRDLFVPGNADQIGVALTPKAGTRPRVTLRLRTVGGIDVSSSQVVAISNTFRFPIPRAGRGSGGTACLRTTGSVAVTGHSGLPATLRPQAFLQGKPLTTGLVSVWFWDTRKRSLASLLPTAARRASVFRAGFVGPWTYVAIVILLPLLWLAGLRLLVRERE